MHMCRRLDGEVVSADSVQIYRHFDIGSAKPSAHERREVPHHLIDVCDPLDSVDAARFVQLAELKIQDILDRGKRPILCGGTFLWLRALIYGLAPAPPANEAIRARHRAEADQFGREHLHARLEAIDPVSHARLAPNDLIRVSRALEVYELSGQLLSDLQAEHGFRTPRHDVHLIAIEHDRALLSQRIEQRVIRMFEQGWLDEVRELSRAGYAEARALRSVGYRQVAEALTAGGPIQIADLVQQITQATRTFVRRQLTWLRDQPVTWLKPADVDNFTPL